MATSDKGELARASLSEHSKATFDVLANDTDANGDTLTLSLLSPNAAHGSVSVDGNKLVYTAGDCVTGVETIAYTIDDGHGGTAGGSLTIAVHTMGSDSDFDGFTDAEEASVGTAPSDPNSTPRSLCGQLSYDRVKAKAGTASLDYSAIAKLPIRAERVELIAGNATAGTGVTDESGTYRFVVGPNAASSVKVRTFAETMTPPIVVKDNVDHDDNTSNDAIYVMDSAAIDLTTTVKADFNAASGYGGVAKCATLGDCYTSVRVAAPFAILDTLYTAAAKFLALQNPPTFEKAVANWSPENDAIDSDDSHCPHHEADGCIGTSHYSDGDTALYILGKEDADTDEYDDHVVAHEWTHYFEDVLSRNDNIGGSHSKGDVLDPRVAFSEGLCNAMSGILLFPDTVYRDSDSVGQADRAVYYDLEDSRVGARSRDLVPGWTSEASVQAIIFDFFDAGSGEPHDTVALGLQPIYNVLIGKHKNTPALASIFSFVDGLKKENTALSEQIDTLVTHHTSSDGGTGFSKIVDEWGSTETHGWSPDFLPVYRTFESQFDGSLWTKRRMYIGEDGDDFPRNKLRANAFARFTGDGNTHRIKAAPYFRGDNLELDIDVYVYYKGKLLASARKRAPATSETTDWFPTVKGETYVVNCRNRDNKTVEFYCNMWVIP